MQAHIFVHDSYSVLHVTIHVVVWGYFIDMYYIIIHLLDYQFKGTICYDDECHLIFSCVLFCCMASRNGFA